eukprot:TRINITY_DN466_c2_g1_i2.p1 TRINITY_DN466_c2_g1~~TRINITY_DN466_c2_g1_i2.p1  ORF type:complete len:384 (-),score=124.47 TRINITY_DN466_c2_g1_i2:54-1205(-)
MLAYHSILVLEKLISNKPGLATSDIVLNCLEVVFNSDILVFPHTWVRQAASRLAGTYFGICSKTSEFNPTKSTTTSVVNPEKVKSLLNHHFLATPGIMYKIAKMMCNQLESTRITTENSEQIVKNLVFLTSNIYKYPSLSPKIENEKFGPANITSRPSGDDNDNDGDGDDANNKDDDMEVDNQQHDYNQDVESEQNILDDTTQSSSSSSSSSKSSSPCVTWIIKRLSYMARRSINKNELTSRSVFQFFGTLTAIFSKEMITENLVSLLYPLSLYSNTITTASTETNQPELIQNIELAKQISELFKEKVGATTFIVSYEKVQEGMNKRRTKRKQDLAIEAITNPQKHAKRKITKNTRRTLKRKSSFGSGSSGGKPSKKQKTKKT